MSIFKKNKKTPEKREWKITEKCLKLIFECAKDSHPKEFGGLLRVNEKDKNLIDELVIIPGTISGDSHAIFRLHMMPIDYTIVGTVHSHPGPIARPSDADLALFRKHGKIHIISAYPYNLDSWNAYDYDGEEIKIRYI